ncbi:MAG: hypothetical protein WB919_08555 [Candidatus Sulfotelmatobacter sp.]
MTTLGAFLASNGSVEIYAYGEIMRFKEAGRFWSRIVVSGVLAGSILGCAAYGQSGDSHPVSPQPTPSQSMNSESAISPLEVSPAEVSSTATTPSTTPAPVTASVDADMVVDPASLLPDLPALPRKKASLIGGSIEKVDHVRDQLTLQIFGGGKMKVAFDPRTHIVEGSGQASTLDLRPGDRVYVDTILDGSTIFARNIRLAMNGAGGKSQGVVVSYQGDELVLRDMLSPDPVKLHFTAGTKILQDGRSAFATQLVPGTLVNVDFTAQKNNREVQQVSILAVPGTDFTFAGRVISLDLHIGLLVLQSANDHKTYEIYLDPSVITVDDRLRAGADVSTVANFDGSRYVARNLTVNSR